MSLPERDLSFLAERGINYEIQEDAGMLSVVFPGWKLPAGYSQSTADLLVRLPGGYPDLAPDMWWFDPPVSRPDGAPIPATEVIEAHLGRNWQRWSRHLDTGQWNSGIDGLESYLSLVWNEARNSAQQVAA